MTPEEALASADTVQRKRATRCLWQRRKLGWDEERAMTTPMDRGASRRKTGGIDAHTTWEDDDECWYYVAHHPGGLTHEQIGEALGGLSRQRVQIIERDALHTLGAALALEGLRESDLVVWLSRDRPGDGSGEPPPPMLGHGIDGEERQRRIAARIDAQEPSDTTRAIDAAITQLEAAAGRVAASLEAWEGER